MTWPRGNSWATRSVAASSTPRAMDGFYGYFDTSAAKFGLVHNLPMRGFLAVIALAASLSAQTPTTVWPQYFGPGRNGLYQGSPLATTWPASGPRVVWRKDVGEGFSGPVVAGGRVILFHREIGRASCRERG